MANVTKKGNGTWHVVLDGAEDFDFGEVKQILAIEICPNAGNDICTIRDGSATAVKIAKVKMTADTDQRYFDFSRFPKRSKDIRPFIANAEVSASVEVIFHIGG